MPSTLLHHHDLVRAPIAPSQCDRELIRPLQQPAKHGANEGHGDFVPQVSTVLKVVDMNLMNQFPESTEVLWNRDRGKW